MYDPIQFGSFQLIQLIKHSVQSDPVQLKVIKFKIKFKWMQFNSITILTRFQFKSGYVHSFRFKAILVQF